MGRVFIEQASLNLLGSVLDTPDYFWEAGVGDHMQSVYDKVHGAARWGWGGGVAWGPGLAPRRLCPPPSPPAAPSPTHPHTHTQVFDYLEMEDRIEVLNARLGLLHELLDMLRLQGQAQHSDFLEVAPCCCRGAAGGGGGRL